VPRQPLPPESLYRACPPEALPFETTRELEEPADPPGQARAIEALELGIAMRGRGYNAFALGPPGVGKHALVRRILERRAAAEPPPDDWCYVADFADPQRPRALRLPPGQAAPFKQELERLVEDLREAIPAVFEGEDYRARLHVLEKQAEEQHEAAMQEVRTHAEARRVAVVRTPIGLAVAPLGAEGVIDPEHFRQLPEEEQTRIQQDLSAVQEELQAVLRSLPTLQRAHRERVRALNREVALFAVEHLVEELRKRHEGQPAVVAHLQALQADVVENVQDFLRSADAEDVAGQVRKLLSETPALRRYCVNMMVDHRVTTGAPVVEEDHPSYANLLGRIDHHVHFGALVTDFTMIRPGALHRANGGYLVLDARRLLMQPLAWEQLKRALEAGQLRVEPPERLYGLSGTGSIEPEPIPLSVKVVLTGDRTLHHLLSLLDPEFHEHFKVAADFEDELPRRGNDLAYARLLAGIARREGLRPLSRAAVARALEQGARLAGDSERLTVRLERLADLLREADHAAGAAGREVVDRPDVEAAVAAAERRGARLRERIREEMVRGTLRVETAGARVGQVNGLSVVQLGHDTFGHPTRITARARLGEGEVLDIEREVELGGPLHSKGVLILAGYLGARYAADRPLPLSASLVFEQSYGGVEGDSASLAELCALLSALSGVPLSQAVAVTGSVDQLGEVQAVGGVNEKIEGFFDLCRERGLDGAQGVIVPAANVVHLMLRSELVEACAAGRFRVWPVERVDEALELLTGMPAGAAGPDGRFPEGTVNARVAARLERFAAEAREASTPLPPRPGTPGAGGS
jgi:lon-related putative ATP-dependent protease